MKKYIKPAIVQVAIESQGLMEASVQNEVGNKVQLGKTSAWDDEEEGLDDLEDVDDM